MTSGSGGDSEERIKELEEEIEELSDANAELRSELEMYLERHANAENLAFRLRERLEVLADQLARTDPESEEGHNQIRDYIERQKSIIGKLSYQLDGRHFEED